MELFKFPIDSFIKRPITTTWVFPKFNWVVGDLEEKSSELVWNRYRVYLECMWWRVKNSLSSMEQICNNLNFSNIRYTASLIDATSNGKKFNFCGHDIYSVVYVFDDRFVIDINVSNRGGNIVFDTSVCNNESVRGIQREDNFYFIQLVWSSYETILLHLLERWKEK